MNNNSNEWVLVTGASKGIGFNYCKNLLKKGYNLIAVARNTDSIKQLQEEYKDAKIKLFNMDLSVLENVYKLFDQCEEFNISQVINNAGFGVWGEFVDTSLDTELNMIDLNIKSLHILTKLFVQRFLKYDFGKIINIASIAAFMPGPAFSSYYASKAYVLNLSTAINTELKVNKKNVRVVTICPGPLKTDFWNTATKGSLNDKTYDYGVPTMDLNKFCNNSLNKALKTKNKNYILLGFWNNLMLFGIRLLPKNIVLKFVYKFQSQREK